jgi:Zn-dependent peptidase ImmA (M78 family)/transcriptional regulator with XRE-family HTH domain
MADKAYITPKLLKWARETAKVSEENAASKVNVTAEKITEWESGLSQPTIRQAQILAKAYRRPFAIFFLDEIPKDFFPLQDFRKDRSKELSTASIFIIREIQQKQTWISNVLKENNEEPLAFVGKFNLQSDPNVVAKDILQTLNIDPTNYQNDNPMKTWIESSEKNGIFISRSSFIHSRLKLDSDEIQGFAIADRFAPFVFINTENWDSAQLFTLVHELAHIWIAQTGISNGIEQIENFSQDVNSIEIFCNKVAAAALIPMEYLSHYSIHEFSDTRELFNISKSLGVSSISVLYRAKNLHLIQHSQFTALRQKAEIEYFQLLKRLQEKKIEQKLKQKEKPGGPNPYLLRLNKNSKLFTQVVLDFVRSGFVQPSQASFLLGTPATSLNKLEAQISKWAI